MLVTDEDIKDAERWRKLVALVGTPQNASDTSIKLFWDDATMTPFVIVGKQSYFRDRSSFEAISSIVFRGPRIDSTLRSHLSTLIPRMIRACRASFCFA